MKNTVIFDLDGTLLDTLEDLREALNYTLGVFNYNAVSLEDTRKFIGHGIRNLIISACGDDIDTDLKFECFKKYYAINCNNNTKPYPYIYRLLDYLKDNDYHLGVVSNKAKYALDILIDSHFDGYFEVIIGDGMDLKKKPEPDMLIEACKELDVTSENIYYIGDSDTDVKTTINFGCDGLFVSYGFRSENELKEAGAKHIFKDANEIISFLEDKK